MDFTHLLRPTSFDTMVGQEHLVAHNASLRLLCEKGALGHTFLYGPAGVGKTSLARVIAQSMQLPFYEFNATSMKIEALRKIFHQYENTLEKPLLFIDEVHRLAKNQQEVLLPVMEKNSIVLLGASTENPFFSLTSAIRSRSMLFELRPLCYDALVKLLKRAIAKVHISIDMEAEEYLVASSGGDARAMLKLLESAIAISNVITLSLLKSLRPYAMQSGSSEAGVHYELISTLIKSMRRSDMDRSVFTLARLIEGGESADFIARRLVIFASEDVGNANPQALTLATSTLTSVKQIGYPEARIILAQAVIYLCASPKSNSAYVAINSALDRVQSGENLESLVSFVELQAIGYEKKMKDWLLSIKD